MEAEYIKHEWHTYAGDDGSVLCCRFFIPPLKFKGWPSIIALIQLHWLTGCKTPIYLLTDPESGENLCCTYMMRVAVVKNGSFIGQIGCRLLVIFVLDHDCLRERGLYCDRWSYLPIQLHVQGHTTGKNVHRRCGTRLDWLASPMVWLYEGNIIPVQPREVDRKLKSTYKPSNLIVLCDQNTHSCKTISGMLLT